MAVRAFSKVKLLALKEDLEKQYHEFQARNLKLDMSRLYRLKLLQQY